jgi:hypothetical protein
MVLEGELEFEIQGWTFHLGRGRGVDSGERAPYGAKWAEQRPAVCKGIRVNDRPLNER